MSDSPSLSHVERGDATPGNVDDNDIIDVTGAGLSFSEALARMTDAEDTLSAIGAGRVDAFVVNSGASPRVFTMSTADRPYRMFVENMRDGAATVSSSGLVLYANRRFAALLDRPIAAIVGTPLATFTVGSRIDDILRPDNLGVTVELDLLDSNGVNVPVLVGSSPLDVDNDQFTCLTFADLSAQRMQEDQIARLNHEQRKQMDELQHAQGALVHQATHDRLTGLPNRGLLVDRVDQVLALARRSDRNTAVFFVDLDRFKHINDSRGHAAGDVVLQKVAQGLVNTVRPMDTVARIGGDEFVVLVPNVDNAWHAVDLGTRFLAEVSKVSDAEGAGDKSVSEMTASIGVALSTGGAGTAETLLEEADTAMYKAKSAGGHRVEIFDVALGRRIQERSRAQEVLRCALDDGRVIAHYQPVVDLSDGRLAGFEALARILERDGSIVMPSAFIQVAEEGGLVVPLGTQILATACEQVSGWHSAASKSKLSIAVNVSSRQFQVGDLKSIVQTQLETNGLDPTYLHLELTETALIDLHPEIIDQLGQIRDLGVEIGLDDFGTGYASLTHLRRLPLTFVKIDQTFIQSLVTDEGDERVVAAVIDLAAKLGLRSIAEGIETSEQYDRLRELGCNQGQGYLFSRPMPPEDVTVWPEDMTFAR